jgi:hypothetical protein
VVLCRAVPSWAVPSWAVPSRAVLSRAVLSRAVLSRAVLSRAALTRPALFLATSSVGARSSTALAPMRPSLTSVRLGTSLRDPWRSLASRTSPAPELSPSFASPGLSASRLPTASPPWQVSQASRASPPWQVSPPSQVSQASRASPPSQVSQASLKTPWISLQRVIGRASPRTTERRECRMHQRNQRAMFAASRPAAEQSRPELRLTYRNRQQVCEKASGQLQRADSRILAAPINRTNSPCAPRAIFGRSVTNWQHRSRRHCANSGGAGRLGVHKEVSRHQSGD